MDKNNKIKVRYKNVYPKLITKFSLEDLKNIRSMLVCDPRIFGIQLETDCLLLDRLNPDIQKSYRDHWIKLTMFNLQKAEELFDFLTKKLNMLTFDANMGENEVTPLHKMTHLFEIIQSRIILLESGKLIPDNLVIKRVECFTSPISDKDYKIAINEDYAKTISVSKSFKTWQLFIEMVHSGFLPDNSDSKYLYDYLNFNSSNLITSNTDYPLQVIVERRDGIYFPTFTGEVLTEKALSQRQAKTKKST